MKSPVKTLLVDNLITQISQGEGQKKESYEYSLESIRETVINMIVHRDYSGQR